jgi:hypothetical protein
MIISGCIGGCIEKEIATTNGYIKHNNKIYSIELKHDINEIILETVKESKKTIDK